MKRFLTIAGSDCCGGAGIQADMRVATHHGFFPMSVITALTAQTRHGVRSSLLTPHEFVAEQLDAVWADSSPDVVKIGMLGNREIVETVADKLKQYSAKNIVLDPVFTSSSGYQLLDQAGILALKDKLLPLCRVITPNIPEAEILSGLKINNSADMEKAAAQIASHCPGQIIITGGHLTHACDDLLYSNGKITWFPAKKIDSKNTHGTGCVFSSCLACNLALGENIEKSIQNTKDYIEKHLKKELIKLIYG